MKKITLIAALLGSAYFANAQVGIGTPTPANSSMLHIEANNKGVIIPNVSLTSTTNFAPITGDQKESLLVYNIADTGTGNTAVTPGFYYWQNNVWQRITTKAELDAAIGNVTVIQTDLGNVKKLLQTAYPANNLDTDTTADTVLSGGGMVFTPGSDSSTVGKIEYVYFNGTDYVKQDITKALQDFIGANETVTSIVTYNKKQYYLSESFNGDTNTSNWTTVPTGAILIDVVGAVVNNFNDIIGDTTTVITVNGDTTTIANYFNSLASDSNTVYFNNTADTTTIGNVVIPSYTFYLKDANGNAQVIDLKKIVQATETLTSLTGDSSTGIISYTPERGDTQTVNIVDFVIKNLNTIINNPTTLDSGTATTLVNYIQNMINASIDNVKLPLGTVTATADTNTVTFNISNGTGGSTPINNQSFSTIVKQNETVTTLKRNEDTSTGEVVITYDYLNEVGDTSTVKLTTDIKTLIEGNTDIKNAISNILNAGGSVYYGQIDSSTTTSVLYTIDANGVKKPIDIATTLIKNTTLTSDSATNVIIQNNIDNLKTNLGDNFNKTTIVKTGDTWIDGKAVYKGIYDAYIVGKTALVSNGASDSPTTVANTVAIPLGKSNIGNIISITVLDASGKKLSTTTTDVSVVSSALKFSIGTGNMYNVLYPTATTNTAIKVLVEFSAE